MAASRVRLMWSLLRTASDGVARSRLMIACFLSLLSGVIAASAPLALKELLDRLSAGQPAVIALSFAGIYVAALAAGRLIGEAQAFAFSSGDQRLQSRMSAAAFRHLLRLPVDFHLRRSPGALVQAHTLALQGARLFLSHAGFTLLPALVQLSIILVVVASLFNTDIWLVVAATMLGYAAAFGWSVNQLGGPTRLAVSAQVDAAALFGDALTNIDAVKSAAAEDRLISRYESLIGRSEQSWRSCFWLRAKTGLAVAVVFSLGMLAIAVLGVSATASRAITVGDFVLLTTYMLQIVQPLELAGFAMRDLAQGANYLDKWAEVERLPEEQGPGSETTPLLLQHPPAIAFENVSFGYGPDRPALTDIDFTLPAGSLVAIVGPSGAGKSSLVRLILGHYIPASGRVLVDGIPVADMDVRELRRRAAVVAQDAPLFNDSLRNNLLFARPDASDHEIHRALAVARLDQMVSALPDGLATQVGERGLSLSGGERQRVAIARAILRNSQLLLLDEATSALDAETEQGLSSDLLQVAQGRTTLVVTHRLALASRAGMILVLNKGQIVERGTHCSLLAGRGLYFRLWQSQSQVGEGRPACS